MSMSCRNIASTASNSRVAIRVKRPCLQPGHKTPPDYPRSPIVFPSQSRNVAAHSDVSAAAKESKLSTEDMFDKTRYLLKNTGYYGPFTQEAKDMLDEDFVFRGPVVGPLTKERYIRILDTFRLYESFPDIEANAWGFSIDPLDPLRVWFMVRETGTMTKPWKPLGPSGPELPATGKAIEVGPSTYSFIFTPEGKAKYFSIGYMADRIVNGAPNGSPGVAIVALFRAAGIENFGFLLSDNPIANANRYVSNIIGTAIDNEVLKYPKYDDLPEWFRNLPNSKLVSGEGM